MRWTALLILPLGLAAANAQQEDPAGKVVQLLRTLNDAYLKKDAAAMKRLMTPDHVAILASGQRQTLDEHLKSLADLKLSEYTMEQVKTVMPGKDVAIVTYQASVKGTFQGKDLPSRIAASSVWVNRQGTWLEALYHETPLPAK